MRIIYSLLILSLCSCVTAKRNADGSTEIKSFGGKGLIKASGHNDLVVMWNNEKSFYHAAMVAGAAITAAGSAYATAAQASVDKASIAGQTARHAAAQETARNATNVGGEVVKSANAANVGLEVPAQIVTPKGY